MINKIVVTATVGLFIASPLARASDTSDTFSTVVMRHPTAADLNALTDARVGIIKAALQLTSDQEKYWPPLERAIRSRAKNRQARLERLANFRDNSPIEAIRDRNPIERMERRAEALSQRGADLKKLADAWEPLYRTLSPDQKERMVFVTYVAMRGMRDAVEHRIQSEDDDD